jgi:hypothetical protein
VLEIDVRWIAGALGAAAFGLLSCATPLPPSSPAAVHYFAPAPASDPWRQKIEHWQVRHDMDPARGGARPGHESELSREYEQFARDLRRRMAADTMAWVQQSSRRFYRPDGDRDHWATYGEVVERGGDDCDGLDLLTFELLRRMGFGPDEIYRAIVVEGKSGQHHMVTLWFEDGPRGDPFVLDPTGVVTSRMVHLSEIAGWQPIELFDEHAHFRVESAPGPLPVAAE